MGTEQIRFSQCGQHSKEGLSTAHFLAEVFEGMRKGVANGKAKGPQTECVQENIHLVADPDRAVLEIAIIEAHPRINEDACYPSRTSQFNLLSKIVMHHGDWVGRQIEIAHLADRSEERRVG